MTENTIRIEDLELKFYTYEGVVQALDKVNLELKKGEILGLVGETGCGKSVTSLSILNLVPTPGRIEGGHIVFYGGEKPVDLLQQKESFLRGVRGKDIAMIFQEPRAYLNPVYTVKDQIGEVLMLHRKQEIAQMALAEVEAKIENKTKTKKTKPGFLLNYERKTLQKMLKNPNALSPKMISRVPLLNRYKRRMKNALREEVVRILRDMELPDPERVVDMYPHELSGGMAQRVVIALALSCNPMMLIADEPTTNLDVTIQFQILNLIRKLQQKYGSAILYITHDLGVVAELCDRVAVMYAGVVSEVAEVEELFKNPLHPYTQALLESIPRPGKEFKSIEGTVPSLITPPSGCRFHDRCSYAMDICVTTKPPYVEAKKEHFVSCHLYPGGSK
jgi:peptide/nickel transport system ATP-binding protein